MKKKSIMAVMLTAILMVSSSAVAFAAQSDTLVSNGWWAADIPKSTAMPLADGASVEFNIDIAEGTNPDDSYAALCVEVSDGTNFFTTTSDGDCWGFPGDPAIGNVIKDTGKASMANGGSYNVVVTRDGYDFTATYTDNSTGEALFGTLYFMAADGVTFTDPTVYVMGQVGTMTVTVEDAAAAPAETSSEATTDVPKTGVVSTALIFGLGAAVLGTGSVVLKKKEK